MHARKVPPFGSEKRSPLSAGKGARLTPSLARRSPSLPRGPSVKPPSFVKMGGRRKSESSTPAAATTPARKNQPRVLIIDKKLIKDANLEPQRHPQPTRQDDTYRADTPESHRDRAVGYGP